MENKVQIYQFDKSISTEQNIKNFILKKIELARALKQMERVKDIYDKEIREHEARLHITKDGQAMFITDMEDSHLINTVKLLLRMGRNFRSSKVSKYVDEVKKRNLVHEIVNLEVEQKEEEPYGEDEDYFDDERPF